MSMISGLKQIVEELPESIGRPLSRVPFTLRLGPTYASFAYKIKAAESNPSSTFEQHVAPELNSLLAEVTGKCAFYQDFYQQQGYQLSAIQSFADWDKVPIVTKSDLQSVSIAQRSFLGRKGMKINTGGTSGQPLEFYLDKNAFAREWAHMHFIWKAHGYRPQHLKLTFRGKHFDSTQAIRYNAVHNEYVVNANSSMEEVVQAVLGLPSSSLIRWLHGYPSLIAEFAHAVAALEPAQIERLRGRLFGALLGSEYPAPVYRSVIESVLTTNVVSWYGHSEMAVLAREIAHGVYQSLPTYGFAEAVPTEDGNAYRLVCTSFHNRVHPFIRYDTGDLIEPIAQAGGSLTFRIAEGRVGDFIVDRNGKRHSLTAIIFGRHHDAFNQLRHLQVREESTGIITLVITPKDISIDVDLVMQGFDLDDLPIEWRIEKVSEPIRTAAGKIRLKLS